jgi:hypothetical protein
MIPKVTSPGTLCPGIEGIVGTAQLSQWLPTTGILRYTLLLQQWSWNGVSWKMVGSKSGVSQTGTTFVQISLASNHVDYLGAKLPRYKLSQMALSQLEH